MVSFCCFGGSKKKGSKEWKEIEALRTEEAERLGKSTSDDAPDNTLIMQAFEWYVPDDKCHWYRLRKALPDLKAFGIDSLWVPPGCKAMRPSDNGYETYDLYDLGEFDQKGSRATKWGCREDLDALTSLAESIGIGIYWDAILNHKAGADYVERFEAVKVDPQDRNLEISLPEKIEGWVGFDFRGRGNVYSPMKYNWHHFSGVDWDNLKKKHAIYKTVGDNKRKQWAQDVSDENGNFDYLMFANLDYSNPEVKKDTLIWGQWISSQLRLSGMRLDAVKHYPTTFQREFIDHLRNTFGQDFCFIGEYWSARPKPLLEYLAKMDYRLSLFDVPLLVRFSEISQTPGGDLRGLFDGTLVSQKPQNAITFVANHDTVRSHVWFWRTTLICPKATLTDLGVARFFKPLAYSLILLRKDGQPCVFYGDLYGIRGGTKRPQPPSCGGKLSLLMLARKLYAYGTQQDYFDTANCVGFVRYGNLRHPDGLACVLSNASAAKKLMYVGKEHAGEHWTDILGWCDEKVTINKRGYGAFPVSKMSVSVWVNTAAEGREALRRQFNDKIYDY